MHGIQDLFVLMRACHGEDLRVVFADVVGFCAQAAGDDDAAIFLERFTDGVERFRFGAVEKPAGVDDDGLCARVIGRDGVAFGAQAGEDAFAINEGFGAAKRDHANGGLAVALGLGKAGGRGEVGAQGGRVLCHVAGYRRKRCCGEDGLWGAWGWVEW